MSVRRGCVDCRLVEPESGQWKNGRCPACTALRKPRIRVPVAGRGSPRFVDLTGRVFHRWTVIERAPNDQGKAVWRCRCECGTEKLIKTVGLIRKNGRGSKSCGCLRRDRGLAVSHDEWVKRGRRAALKAANLRRSGKGQPVEERLQQRRDAAAAMVKLRAIDLTGKNFSRLSVIEKAGRNTHGPLWRCRCECGTEVTVNTRNLRSGNTQSCGCWKRELFLLRAERGRLSQKNHRSMRAVGLPANELEGRR